MVVKAQKSFFIASTSLFSAAGLLIVFVGPLIKSVSGGLPGGWVILPLFITYLEILSHLKKVYPLLVGGIVGLIAMWFPMMGGMGPISLLVGFSAGICAYFFDFNSFYSLKLLFSSLFVIIIVVLYFGLLNRLDLLKVVLILTSLSSLTVSFILKSSREKIIKMIKKEYKERLQ